MELNKEKVTVLVDGTTDIDDAASVEALSRQLAAASNKEHCTATALVSVTGTVVKRRKPKVSPSPCDVYRRGGVLPLPLVLPRRH